MVVEVLDHARVELHLPAEERTRRGCEHDRIGQEPHALGELRAGGHDPEVDLALETLLAHRVPALAVGADVAVAPVARQVEGVVRRWWET